MVHVRKDAETVFFLSIERDHAIGMDEAFGCLPVLSVLNAAP